MRTSLIAASVILIGATAMAAPQAGTKTAAKPAATAPASPKPTAMKAAHASGTVEKFDAATHTLTVKVNGKDESFVIGEKTSLMKGKNKADTAALVAGSTVKVEYMAMGTTKTAEKIEVSAPKAAKPATKK